MIALQITELKSFMGKLLATNMFDDFLLQEAVLQMGISYVIDGHINEAFYSQEEEPQLTNLTFIPYKEVRSTLFELIKGKRTPLGFQIVLQLSPIVSNTLFPEGLQTHLIKGLIANIRFDGSKAIITSAVNYTSFSMEKEPEHIWDQYLTAFFVRAGVSFETL